MVALLSPVAKRLVRLERLLRGAGIPAGGVGPSLPTFKRDLQRLRADLGAVVVFDTFEHRYALRNPEWAGVIPALVAEAARFGAAA